MKRFLFLALWGLANLPPSAVAGPSPDAEAVTAAASSGDATALAGLLDKNGPLNTRNAHGWTPLICALNAGKPEAVRVLLAHHADPNGLSKKGCSPLDFAVMCDRDESIPLLLDAGADVNGFRVENSKGDACSPLFLALERHRPATIRLLLARGARLEDKNNQGNTALMEGCKRPFVDQIDLLIERGANVNARGLNGHSALIYAAYNGCEEIVRLLLSKGADLQAAATDGPGEPRYGALEVATEQGRPYVLEVLADAGAKPANRINPLNLELGEALSSNDYERAQAALANGASPNEPGLNDILPMTSALYHGNPAMLRLLINAGVNVNASLGNGPADTPMAFVQKRMRTETDPRLKQSFQQMAELFRQAHAVE